MHVWALVYAWGLMYKKGKTDIHWVFMWHMEHLDAGLNLFCLETWQISLSLCAGFLQSLHSVTTSWKQDMVRDYMSFGCSIPSAPSPKVKSLCLGWAVRFPNSSTLGILKFHRSKISAYAWMNCWHWLRLDRPITLEGQIKASRQRHRAHCAYWSLASADLSPMVTDCLTVGGLGTVCWEMDWCLLREPCAPPFPVVLILRGKESDRDLTPPSDPTDPTFVGARMSSLRRRSSAIWPLNDSRPSYSSKDAAVTPEGGSALDVVLDSETFFSRLKAGAVPSEEPPSRLR